MPRPSPTDTHMRITTTTICGTDIYILKALVNFSCPLPWSEHKYEDAIFKRYYVPNNATCRPAFKPTLSLK